MSAPTTVKNVSIVSTKNTKSENSPSEIESTLEKGISQKYLWSLVEKTGYSDYYTQLRKEGFSRAEAYPLAAKELVNNTGSELSHADKDAIIVTAHIGAFLQANHQLQQLRRHDYPNKHERQQMSELKTDYIIPFNHAAKEFVNSHPNNNIITVSKNLGAVYAALYGKQDCLHPGEHLDKHTAPRPEEIVNSLYSTFDGMRHELAAEALLDEGGVEYEYNTTVDEDRRGSDIIVKHPHYGWVGIDVKASVNAESYARQEHRLSRAVYTGLNDEDFTGQTGEYKNALSVPYYVIEQKCNDFCNRSYQAIEHYISEKEYLNNNQYRRKIGRASVR